MPQVFSAPKTNISTGLPIAADTRGLARLARDLRAASPAAWKAYRVAARALAEPVAADARQRASFSSRIPATIKIRVTGAGNVKIVAGGEAAPDAAPYEHGGRPGYFRHPVYGNREVWVDQTARPFLAPALAAHEAEVVEGISRAVTDAVALALRG